MENKGMICFAIFTGKIFLPFSIRTTKKQAITDFINDRNGTMEDYIERGYSVGKVIVKKLEAK